MRITLRRRSKAAELLAWAASFSQMSDHREPPAASPPAFLHDRMKESLLHPAALTYVYPTESLPSDTGWNSCRNATALRKWRASSARMRPNRQGRRARGCCRVQYRYRSRHLVFGGHDSRSGAFRRLAPQRPERSLPLLGPWLSSDRHRLCDDRAARPGPQPGVR
ncbi:putative transmembrane GGDEF sensory box protein [Rhizobium etli CNPAF512]|nr:putative transmembrane GGDEF sensory box protein [Rhizobium etli CNPAF512]